MRKKEILSQMLKWVKDNNIKDLPTIKKAKDKGYWIYKHNDSEVQEKLNTGFFVDDSCLEFNDFTNQTHLQDTLEMIVYEHEYEKASA